MSTIFSIFISQPHKASAFVAKSLPSLATGRISIHRRRRCQSSFLQHRSFHIQPRRIPSLLMVLKDPADQAQLSRDDGKHQQPIRKLHMTGPTSQPILNDNSTLPNVEPLVICGPSGVGKGTIIQGLMERFPNDALHPFGFSVSHTTRQPRPGEEHGTHYYFTNMEDMQQQIDDGRFVEHAHVHGNLYGTSKQAIADLQAENKITILDIDMQGVKSVKESNLPAKYIFIAPPSFEELEGRLRGRATETEEAIQRRLGNAAKEIEYGQTEGNFDQVIVNDSVDEAVQKLVDTLEEWYPQLRIVDDGR